MLWSNLIPERHILLPNRTSEQFDREVITFQFVSSSWIIVFCPPFKNFSDPLPRFLDTIILASPHVTPLR